MNGRKAKSLRKLAKVLITENEAVPVTRFYITKDENGTIKDTLVPMPVEWPKGTFRNIYQRLKG